MMKKKVTVLMSTYNGENYIRTQIDSILAQRGDFLLNLWVRDDGSQDSTTKILREYEKEGKLIWYEGENLRPAKSFLQLLKTCDKSDYYAFSDQDDYWFPDKLKKGLELLDNEEEPQIAFSNANLVNKDLQKLDRLVYRKEPAVDFYTVICAPNVLGCTMVFNTALAELIRTRPLPGNVIMHDAYLAGICTAAGGRILYDEKASMDYRQHGQNVLGIKSKPGDVLLQRIREIFTREDIGIAEQAEEILKNCGSLMSPEYQEFAEKVAEYKKSFFSRIDLACSRKPRYFSKNTEFMLRMAILLGNR